MPPGGFCHSVWFRNIEVFGAEHHFYPLSYNVWRVRVVGSKVIPPHRGTEERCTICFSTAMSKFTWSGPGKKFLGDVPSVEAGQPPGVTGIEVVE